MITVGYGDILARKQNEIYFTIFTIIFSCIVFGFVLGKVGALILGEDEIISYFKSFFEIEINKCRYTTT